MKMVKVFFVGSILASLVFAFCVSSAKAESEHKCTPYDGVCICAIIDSIDDVGILRTRSRKTRAVGRSARKSVRARNAERRRQRQLRGLHEQLTVELLDVFADLIEQTDEDDAKALVDLFDEAVKDGDSDLAAMIVVELARAVQGDDLKRARAVARELRKLERHLLHMTNVERDGGDVTGPVGPDRCSPCNYCTDDRKQLRLFRYDLKR